MADVLPTESAVEVRLREFLAAELRRAELDFPLLARRAVVPDRRPLRVPVGVFGGAVVVVAFIALASRFLTGGSGHAGAPQASASALVAGSSAASSRPSPSVALSPSPSPTPSAGLLVDCGRISPQACATAIDLVRAGHEAEVGGATRIVLDDTCPPPVECDRKYPFDSIVVFVTAGGDTTGWYAFSVVGLDDNTPTTVRPWVGDIPAHVVQMLTGAQPEP